MIRSTRPTAKERRWLRVLSTLNEYQARLYVADRAIDHGRGGITRLSKLTGMSRTTITKAVAELCGGGHRWRRRRDEFARREAGGRKQRKQIRNCGRS